MKDSSIQRIASIKNYINSVQQKTNIKWKVYSNVYSKLLIRFPWSILTLAMTLAIGLTVYFLLFMEIRPFNQSNFTVSNGQAVKNAFRIREIFGNDVNLRMHQQLNLYPGLDVIIKRKVNMNEKNNPNKTNMLNNEIIDEIRLLDEQIQSVRIKDASNSVEYNYSSLCIKINRACTIDGNYILSDKFRQDFSNLHPPKHNYYFDTSGANGIPAFMFGKNYQITNSTPIVLDYEDEKVDGEHHDDNNFVTASEQIISHISLYRLRYSLNVSTDEMHRLAIQWEREALRYINNEYKSVFIDIFPSISTILQDTIEQTAHDEGLIMSLMILLFLVLVSLSLSLQGNVRTSVGYLPICAIISIVLSTGSTFGILSIFRIAIVEPMALLIFIVVVIDCMRCSIVCSEYHRVINEHITSKMDPSSEIDIGKILPSIIESTHPYFITSTLVVSIIYLLYSICSPMLSTKIICSTFALYAFVNYITHATFFSSCLVITLKRISSRRHCFLCFRLSNDYLRKTSNNYSEKFKSLINFYSNWKKIISSIFCLLSIAFSLFAIWNQLSIDTRLYDDRFLPENSTKLRSYMKSQDDDFDIGPVIMFTIPQEIDYESDKIKNAMHSLIERCQNESRINKFKLIWLDYESVELIKTGIEKLSMRITPFSQNDIIVTEGQNHSNIIATRFYCQYNSIKGDSDDIRTMNNMYAYSIQSLIPSVFPYSVIFPIYESLEQIRIDSYFIIVLLILFLLINTFLLFLSFRNSCLLIYHSISLITGTSTCLYLFHNLTFNFGNALWLFIVPVVFIETLIHETYNKTNNKWKYNRVIISLIISLLVLYSFSIQSYVFQTICNSLLYQSFICLVVINFIIPSYDYLFPINQKNVEIHDVIKPTSTTDINQSLTNESEVKATHIAF